MFSYDAVHIRVIVNCRMTHVSSAAELYPCFFLCFFQCYIIKQLLTIEALDMM